MKEHTIIEERENESYIECPRCTTPVPFSTQRAYELEGSQGQMVTEIDAMEDDHSCMTTSCIVCDGTERVKVPYTSPLPVCLRCRGRGFVVQSKWNEIVHELEEVSEELDEVRQIRKQREEEREYDGVIDKLTNKLFSDVLSEEEKEKRNRLREKRDELMERLPDERSERFLTIETCPFCEGKGVDNNDQTEDGGFIVECTRCNGVGEMVTKTQFGSEFSDDSILEVAKCGVCSGEGAVTVYSDPPYSKCSNCTNGIDTDKNMSLSGMHTESAHTCDQCDGLGFLAEFGTV